VGIGWMIFALIVLQFDVDSIYAVAVFAGIIFFAAGITEFGAVFAVEGWKWFHAIPGILLSTTN